MTASAERVAFRRPSTVFWFLARAAALVVVVVGFLRAEPGAVVATAFVTFVGAHAVVHRRLAAAGAPSGRWGPLGVPARVRSTLRAAREGPAALAPFVAAAAAWMGAEWVLIGWAAGVLALGWPVP